MVLESLINTNRKENWCILDTSFILTCLRQKIDFFDEITLAGLNILIPQQVIKEIENLSESKKEAKVFLKLLEKEKNSFKKVDLKSKNVDKGIIRFAEKNKEIIVATLDKEIKDKTSNKKMVVRNKKTIEVIGN